MNISLNLLRCFQQKKKAPAGDGSNQYLILLLLNLLRSSHCTPQNAGPDVASSHWCSVRRLDSRGPAALSSDVAGRSPRDGREEESPARSAPAEMDLLAARVLYTCAVESCGRIQLSS